jgi:hypothetical protein
VIETRWFAPATRRSPTFVWVAVLQLGGACARGPAPAPAPVSTCAIGDSAFVRELVYFGRNRPDGGTVSDAEWEEFLDEVVTPRFPTGLTVIQATGRWKGQSGVTEQERSEIVTLLHAGGAEARQAVVDIAAEYKRRFHQEAVLRERTTTCARFE